MITDAPCKGCEDRSLGCHATCSKYIEYAKYAEEQREKRHERQKVVDGLYATQRKTSAIKRRKDS